MRISSLNMSCGVVELHSLYPVGSGKNQHLKQFLRLLKESAEYASGFGDELEHQYGMVQFSDHYLEGKFKSNGQKLAQQLVDAGFKVSMTQPFINPNSNNRIAVWCFYFDKEAFNKVCNIKS